MAPLLLFVTTFLASAVEAVEALTVVLAMGLTRGFRAALIGVGVGLAVLAVTVAILGPALTSIPIDVLRLVVGVLLLIFGLQWLRKAILRAAGVLDQRDEDAAFVRDVRAAEGAPGAGTGFDRYSFAMTFKVTLLEGLEVAFIVITFGSTQGRVGLAAAAAVAAVLVVTAVGVAARAPLARVPENAIKFGVGLLLTTFGTFWAGEGASVDWPGGDVIILPLLVVYAAAAWLMVEVLRPRPTTLEVGE